MSQQVIAQVTVVPLGTASTSLDRYVAACHDCLKRARDVSYQLTAMGTIIQGTLPRVLELVTEMHQVPFTLGAARVLTTLSIDDRRDKSATIEGKVAAVRKAAGDG